MVLGFIYLPSKKCSVKNSVLLETHKQHLHLLPASLAGTLKHSGNSATTAEVLGRLHLKHFLVSDADCKAGDAKSMEMAKTTWLESWQQRSSFGQFQVFFDVKHLIY